MRIAKIFAHYRKLGLRNTMATSDLRSKVEIWPFHACAMKSMQYNHYYGNSSVIVDLAMGQIPHSTERISSNYCDHDGAASDDTYTHQCRDSQSLSDACIKLALAAIGDSNIVFNTVNLQLK